jgi:hypothetical protein
MSGRTTRENEVVRQMAETRRAAELAAVEQSIMKNCKLTNQKKEKRRRKRTSE